MLRKKCIIQKSFRIDYQLSNDLEYLSNVLDRPQNDLINIALENLINDNQIWFIQDIILDKSKPFFDTLEDFELKIDNMNFLYEVIDKRIIFVATAFGKDDKRILDYGEEYDFEQLEKLKEDLRELSQYLDVEGKDVQKYMRKRLDYK